MKIKIANVQEHKDGGHGILVIVNDSIYINGIRIKNGMLLPPGVRLGRGYANHVLLTATEAEALYDALLSQLRGTPYEGIVKPDAFLETMKPLIFGPKDEMKWFGENEEMRQLRAQVTSLKRQLELTASPSELAMNAYLDARND